MVAKKQFAGLGRRRPQFNPVARWRFQPEPHVLWSPTHNVLSSFGKARVHRLRGREELTGDRPDIVDVAATPNVRSMCGSHRPISNGYGVFKAWTGYQVGSHSMVWFQA